MESQCIPTTATFGFTVAMEMDELIRRDYQRADKHRLKTGEDISAAARNSEAAIGFIHRWEHQFKISVEDHRGNINTNINYEKFALMQFLGIGGGVYGDVSVDSADAHIHSLKFPDRPCGKYEQWCRDTFLEFLNESPYEYPKDLDYESAKHVSWDNHQAYLRKFTSICMGFLGDVDLYKKGKKMIQKQRELKSKICTCEPVMLEMGGQTHTNQHDHMQVRPHIYCWDRCPNKNTTVFAEYEAIGAYVASIFKSHEKTTLTWKMYHEGN